LAILEFELRISYLLGRFSAAWATPPALFALVILEIGSLHFCPGQPRLQSSYFKLPTIARRTSAGHHTYSLSIKMGPHKLFYPG
jgi:hypothetical protein